MTLEQVLNWLLLPALGGLAWIARSVSRLETQVCTLQASNTELWKHVNKHTEDIADANTKVAHIQGQMDR